MKIILTKDISKIGKKGQVVDVAEGYARNFLFKQNSAILATNEAIKKLENEKAQKDTKKEKQLKHFTEYKKEIEKRTFTLKVKTGQKGQVFGGVHEKDLIAVIYQKTKIQLDKSQIQPMHGIKTLGEHSITIKLGQGIVAKTKINLEAN